MHRDGHGHGELDCQRIMKPGRINKIEAGQDEAATVGSKPVVGYRHIYNVFQWDQGG